MVKEVKNNINLEFLLNQLKSKSPSQISKEYKISKQLISYYLRTLKSKGLIQKIGYGVWEVKNIPMNIPIKQVKIIRGHAFIWNLKLSKEFNWKKFNLKQLKNKTYQIIINNRKIWLGKKTITIYENKDFYGINSIDARKNAVFELLSILDTLQKQLDIKLGNYGLKVSKEHYSMIKNELANEYNKRKEKMRISDTLEGEWIWIDFSDGIDELETKNLVRSKQVQDWWNDNKKHDFKVTPTFLMEMMHGIQQNQLIFDKNMSSHLKVLDKLGNAVDELRKEIKKKKISLKEYQSSINDF